MFRNRCLLLVCAALLALCLQSMPGHATEAPSVAHTSTSVNVSNDVRLKDVTPIPATVFLDNLFGWDSRVAVMVRRRPYNDRLPGNGKARGRLRADLDCITRISGQASLGRVTARFDADSGAAAGTRTASGNRNCLAYTALAELSGNQIQPEGSTLAVDFNVQLLPPSAPSECFDETHLCFIQGRFMGHLAWQDAAGNQGEAVGMPQTDNSGHFYLRNPQSHEVRLQVINGCGINNFYWVLLDAATNAAYTVTVTDTESGMVQTYTNPLGVAAPAVQDTQAFATCP